MMNSSIQPSDWTHLLERKSTFGWNPLYTDDLVEDGTLATDGAPATCTSALLDFQKRGDVEATNIMSSEFRYLNSVFSDYMEWVPW